MLRITVELVSARTGKIETLGVATITNTGTGTKERGNYIALVKAVGGKRRLRREVEVEGYPRLQRNAWDLLAYVLRKAGLGRDFRGGS